MLLGSPCGPEDKHGRQHARGSANPIGTERPVRGDFAVISEHGWDVSGGSQVSQASNFLPSALDGVSTFGQDGKGGQDRGNFPHFPLKNGIATSKVQLGTFEIVVVLISWPLVLSIRLFTEMQAQ